MLKQLWFEFPNKEFSWPFSFVRTQIAFILTVISWLNTESMHVYKLTGFFLKIVGESEFAEKWFNSELAGYILNANAILYNLWLLLFF
jgi:hypothetical protein